MRWLVGGGEGRGGGAKVKRGSGEGDGKQHQISDCITSSQQLYTLIYLLLLTSSHVGGTTALRAYHDLIRRVILAEHHPAVA